MRRRQYQNLEQKILKPKFLKPEPPPTIQKDSDASPHHDPLHTKNDVLRIIFILKKDIFRDITNISYWSFEEIFMWSQQNKNYLSIHKIHII
jgi:hypothetical protein